MIKLFLPYIPENIMPELEKTIFSGRLAQGPRVEEFESKFASLFNVEYPVSLNSGSASLEMAYDLLELKDGDEVITTPLTCTATNIPLLARKVKIVWADILPDTLCIDPFDVYSKITEKTKAIVQVHLGGISANISKSDIPIISDACQALGIFVGNYTCCSFQAIKHITTGDGGMLIVDNEKEYKKAKLMRWFGVDRDIQIPNDWTAYRTRMMAFDIDLIGYKKHMNDIAATLGLAGLKDYDAIVKHRSEIFAIYRHRLSGFDGIKLVDGRVNVYWLATLLVERRDDFARKLFEAGIETNIVQRRNDVYEIFGGKKADLPVLDSIEDKYISIPIGMHVSQDEANYICDVIRSGW